MLNFSVAQINPIVGDLDYNDHLIRQAWRDAPAGTDLLVFPELITCGYPPEDLVLKPFFVDQIKARVQSLARDSINFACGALISAPWDGHNAAILIADGDIQAVRYKHHLPNYSVFDEKRIFRAGPLPAPIHFRGVDLGVLTCEDLWFDDVSAHLKSQGAQILIALNASPFDMHKTTHRYDVARARCVENNLPLLYVNQVGGQDELVFDGASFMMDAHGEVVFRAPMFQSHVGGVDGKSNPAAHDQNAQIYDALVLGLRDYVQKNKFPGILLGLSGGIDSALCAVIAADAIGADKVQCVMLPSRYTSQESLEDAQHLAQKTGIILDEIAIEGCFEAAERAITPLLPENPASITFENLQSRTRGLLLMALSNASGKMLLTTGNKSEMAVGYATLYGDMCGGYNAIKDLYKTKVYDLCRWINRHEEIIPERIITKAPTAELRDNQTDQDSLPEYDILDDILYCLIEEDMALEDIIARGHPRDVVQHVWRLLDRAEYKRRQAAPGTKITARAFGRDRRYPITSGFLNIIENNTQ